MDKLVPLVVGLVLLAGCSAVPGGDGVSEPSTTSGNLPKSTTTLSTTSPPTSQTQAQTFTTVRPCHPTPNTKTFNSTQKPEPPETLTRNSTKSYVAAHANATVWNDVFAGESYVSAGTGPTRLSVVEAGTDRYVVNVTVGMGWTFCDDGQPVAGDGFASYTYYLNETAVRRVSSDGNSTVVWRAGGE